MKSKETRSNKHYTLEMYKAGDELSVCYWPFDKLEEAQAFIKTLRKGCTAYNVQLVIFDEMQNFIEGYRIGDEDNPYTKLASINEVRFG